MDVVFYIAEYLVFAVFVCRYEFFVFRENVDVK